MWLSAHAQLALGDPKMADCTHIGTLTLLRHQLFYYMSSQPV